MKLVSPERRRRCVHHVRQAHRVFERRACPVLEQPRTSQRYQVISASDEESLTGAIVRLAEAGRDVESMRAQLMAASIRAYNAERNAAPPEEEGSPRRTVIRGLHTQ